MPACCQLLKLPPCSALCLAPLACLLAQGNRHQNHHVLYPSPPSPPPQYRKLHMHPWPLPNLARCTLSQRPWEVEGRHSCVGAGVRLEAPHKGDLPPPHDWGLTEGRGWAASTRMSNFLEPECWDLLSYQTKFSLPSNLGFPKGGAVLLAQS